MKKRLTRDQKTYAIMDVLCKTAYPVTPTQISKAIGFSRPNALYAALDELAGSGFVTFYEQEFLGHAARYFFATSTGRQKYCELMTA